MMGSHLSVNMSTVGRIRRGTVMFSVNWLILKFTGGSVPFLGEGGIGLLTGLLLKTGLVCALPGLRNM